MFGVGKHFHTATTSSALKSARPTLPFPSHIKGQELEATVPGAFHVNYIHTAALGSWFSFPVGLYISRNCEKAETFGVLLAVSGAAWLHAGSLPCKSRKAEANVAAHAAFLQRRFCLWLSALVGLTWKLIGILLLVVFKFKHFFIFLQRFYSCKVDIFTVRKRKSHLTD